MLTDGKLKLKWSACPSKLLPECLNCTVDCVIECEDLSDCVPDSESDDDSVVDSDEDCNEGFQLSDVCHEFNQSLPTDSGIGEGDSIGSVVSIINGMRVDDEEDPTILDAAESVLLTFQEASTQTSDDIPESPASNGSERETVTSKKLTILDLLKTDHQLKVFTGVTFALLEKLEMLVTIVLGPKRKTILSVRERIVLTLCLLRLNVSYEVLSVFFGIDRRLCATYFANTIHALAVVLQSAIYWPSREENMKNMPKCFKKFQKTRVVLDCTEIPAPSPDCTKCRIRMYSHYKKGLTAKVLIGVAPSGLITFVSKAYGGKASDKFIFEQSDLVQKNLLEPFLDSVMVDKGFKIDKACTERNLPIIRPPFVRNKKQHGCEEAMRNAQIANARVHVERAIQRIKIFKILQSKLSSAVMPHIDDIFIVICGLTNLGRPILAAHRFISEAQRQQWPSA